MYSRLLDSITQKCLIPIPDCGYETMTDTVLNKFSNCNISELKKESYSTWYFSGTDNYINFKKNLKIFKKKYKNEKWYYENNPVKYTLNSFGYRTKQFDEIDWSNSILIFGCSFISGVGVDDKHTISSFLEKELNIPIINLGVGGSSNSFHLHNSMILSSFYPAPKAVIYVWSNMERYFRYIFDNVQHHGSWDKYLNTYSQDSYDGLMRNIVSMISIKNTWVDKTVFLNCCWNITDFKFYNSVIPDLNLFYLNYDYEGETDPSPYNYLARDMSHPGPILHKKAAKQLSKILKSYQL
jgi:hypothetical protein